MDKTKSTITLTFSERIENHVGMQQIGELAEYGFTVDDLKNAKNNFEDKGLTCELVLLNDYLPKNKTAEQAGILIIRKGVDLLTDNKTNEMFAEQAKLEFDKKAYMRGRVVNKNARYNLCFADIDQEPDYENKKGRIISFAKLPLLKQVRDSLDKYIGEKAKGLFAEGNYYYDVATTGIGFHSDLERKMVVAVRLGQSMCLHYHWFLNCEPIGRRVKLMINDGDMYIMSEKASGFDGRKRSQAILRHAAGCDKYLKLKVKKKKNVPIEKKIIPESKKKLVKKA